MKFKEFGKWAGILAAIVILAVGTVCLTNAEERKDKTGRQIEDSGMEQTDPVRKVVSGENGSGSNDLQILYRAAVKDLPDGYHGEPEDSLEKRLSELTGKVYEFVPNRGVKEEIAEHGVWSTGIYTDESGKKIHSYSLANSEDYDQVTLGLDFTFDADGNLVDHVSKDYGFIQGMERTETEKDSFYGIKHLFRGIGVSFGLEQNP